MTLAFSQSLDFLARIQRDADETTELLQRLTKPALEIRRSAFVSAPSSINEFWAQWSRAHDRLRPDARWLGRVGWTLPMDMDPRIAEKLHATKSAERANAEFRRYYTARRSAQLRRVQSELLASKGLKPWRRTIRESISAFEARKYALVLPSLLTIVEGAIMAATGQLRTDQVRTREIARLAADRTERPMRRLIWTSVEGFVSTVFGRSSFAGKRPKTINRHWVLHGRGIGYWRRLECIRLYHALHTILALVDRPQSLAA